MWRLNTFGAVCFFTQNKQLGVRLSSASKALISFLSIHRGRSDPRDELAYAVWAADYDKKLQHRLSNIVWRLGNLSSNLKIAGAAGFFFVEPSGNMRLNDCSGMHIDFDMLENAVRTCQINPTLATSAQIETITSAASLYLDDFMRELDLEWVVEKRNYVRQCYLDVLVFLIKHYKR